MAAGLLMLLVAVFSNQLGLSHGGVGKSRILLGLFGILLTAVGTLKRRFVRLYTSTAIMVTNTAVLLICLEVGAMVANRCLRAGQAVSQDAAAREVVQTRVSQRMYVGWEGQPFRGEAITIDSNGLRRTPACLKSDTEDPIRLFAFGGSTMWGEGAADHETIAAHLQTMLSDQSGAAVEVTNYGQRAWVSTQSMIRLVIELQQGNVPDVVVFYDGYNDIYAAYVTGRTGVPENFTGQDNSTSGWQELVRKASQTETGQFISRFRQPWEPLVDVESLSLAVAQNYLRVLQFVRRLGVQYDFDVQFYWQPQLFTDQKPLTQAERALLDHPWLPPIVKDLTTEIYSQAAVLAVEQDCLTDISDAFDGMAEQVYLDPCHVRGIGNKRIAQAMLKKGRLLEIVQQRVRSRTETEHAVADMQPKAIVD